MTSDNKLTVVLPALPVGEENDTPQRSIAQSGCDRSTGIEGYCRAVEEIVCRVMVRTGHCEPVKQ